MGRWSHHGVPGVLRGQGAGRQTATTAPGGARYDALGTNHTRCWMSRHALRGLSRDGTGKPTGSYQFVGYCHRLLPRQWSPTVNGPPRTPGAPRSRFDRDEPPPRAVRPSQHALARLLLPAFYGIGCLAHPAWVQMRCTVIPIPSVSPYVDQGSTDFEVRRGLKVTALLGHPYPYSDTPNGPQAGGERRQAGTDFAVSIDPTPRRHPRPGGPEPEQPRVPGVIAGISLMFPFPALCNTPPKGNVCPDGAPGSRATSFWSPTTPTLAGGAAKGPR
jgi:hypothetical protein